MLTNFRPAVTSLLPRRCSDKVVAWDTETTGATILERAGEVLVECQWFRVLAGSCEPSFDSKRAFRFIKVSIYGKSSDRL